MAVSVNAGTALGPCDALRPTASRVEDRDQNPAPRLPARRVGQQQCRRQVSWLSGRCARPPSRFPSGIKASHSPITVAGAAAAWGECPHRVP